MTLKQSLRKAIYHSGFLHRYHKKKNRNALTVVLFHRVLPEGSPEWDTADPEWSVTSEFFEECLVFFKKHYSVVSFPQVLDHYLHDAALPDHPLLITFDDGWKCNLQHAAPLLSKFGFPAIIFVTSGALGRPILSWQEALYALWKKQDLDDVKIAALSRALDMELPTGITDKKAYVRLLGILRSLPPGKRSLLNPLLFEWTADLPGAPLMLEKDEITQLQEQGFYIGTHGVSHESLVNVEDIRHELYVSKQTLENIIGQSAPPIQVFSPPHGQYDQEILKTAQEVGYLCTCTSRNGLNPTTRHEGMIDLGRINIDQPCLLNQHGRLDPSKLASMLFRLPLLEHN